MRVLGWRTALTGGKFVDPVLMVAVAVGEGGGVRTSLMRDLSRQQGSFMKGKEYVSVSLHSCVMQQILPFLRFCRA